MIYKGIILLIGSFLFVHSGYAGNKNTGRLRKDASAFYNIHPGPRNQYELPVYKNCPVIYDNDDHRDVYTDEYLLSLASIGEIDLKGIITTYSPKEYPVFTEGRKYIMKIASGSGLKHLPQLFQGTNKKLVPPSNYKIEDTVPLDIDGSHYIVKVARQCSNKKPLVIIAGGQLTSVANAFLIDPSIADNVVVMGVFGADRIDYNAGLDSWAWTIVLARFRVVAIPIGPPDNRGAVYMKPPEVAKDRILNELDQSIPFFRWMYEKKHPSNGLPAESDYDGHPAVLITAPDYVTQWTRYRFESINDLGRPVLIKDENGPVFQAVDANQDIATDEYWRVLLNLNRQLKLRQNKQLMRISKNGEAYRATY